MNWNELIADPIRQMLTRILDYLPILLGALIILIVGWIVAKAIRRLVNWLLKAVRFDAMADKTGISEVLRKGDLKITAREVVSSLVYWLIIIMVLVMTVDALGLPKAADVPTLVRLPPSPPAFRPAVAAPRPMAGPEMQIQNRSWISLRQVSQTGRDAGPMQRVGELQLKEAVLVLAFETAVVVDARDDRLSPRLVC